jgi:hypothetical protein
MRRSPRGAAVGPWQPRRSGSAAANRWVTRIVAGRDARRGDAVRGTSAQRTGRPDDGPVEVKAPASDPHSPAPIGDNRLEVRAIRVESPGFGHWPSPLASTSPRAGHHRRHERPPTTAVTNLSPGGEHPPTPALPGLARPAAPVHARSPRHRARMAVVGARSPVARSRAVVGGCSTPAEVSPVRRETGACGRGWVLPAGRGRRLRAWVGASGAFPSGSRARAAMGSSGSPGRRSRRC